MQKLSKNRGCNVILHTQLSGVCGGPDGCLILEAVASLADVLMRKKPSPGAVPSPIRPCHVCEHARENPETAPGDLAEIIDVPVEELREISKRPRDKRRHHRRNAQIGRLLGDHLEGVACKAFIRTLRLQPNHRSTKTVQARRR